MNRAIIIMAKVPIAGKVKTRLQPFIAPHESAELATCFLQDAVNKANTVTGNVIVAYAPDDEKVYLQTLIGDDILLIPQSGDALGERIDFAFEAVFIKNFCPVLMIGTDSPSISNSLLNKAFEALETSDAVIGKTLDGGFYLIGLNRIYPDLFDGIEWSSHNTFSQTIENFKRFGLRFCELPISYDVDTPDDLRELFDDESLRNTAPLTFKYLATKKDTKR